MHSAESILGRNLSSPEPQHTLARPVFVGIPIADSVLKVIATG